MRLEIEVSVDLAATHGTAAETREADGTDAAVTTRQQHPVNLGVLTYDTQCRFFVVPWRRLAITVSTSGVVVGVRNEQSLRR